MSGVLLRCPNCGTTRSTPGECEACHEAQVRYYCTNHLPGRWLDSPMCAQCGARFGELARPPAPAAAPAASPARKPTAPPKPAPAPARPAPPLRPRHSPPPSPGRSPEPRPHAEASDKAPDLHDRPVIRTSSLQDLLVAAARARRRRPEALPGTYAETAPSARRPGGCLVRFVLLMVFLFLALISGVFVFGGSLLRMFLSY